MPAALGGHAFERHRAALGEHLLVVLDESPRGFFGIELEVVFADHFGRRAAHELRGRLVDEDVAAVEILDENRVGRGVDDRQENV